MNILFEVLPNGHVGRIKKQKDNQQLGNLKKLLFLMVLLTDFPFKAWVLQRVTYFGSIYLTLYQALACDIYPHVF